MTDSYLGQIVLFAGNFAPKNWALCQGQVLSIQQNAALFAILGTTYGGNGTTNFALPDLRGRVAVSQGQAPGLSSYVLGEVTGQETVALNTSQMPTHNHLVQANNGTSSPTVSPQNAYLSETHTGSTPPVTGIPTYATALTNPTTLASATIQSQGGSSPHNNIQPTLALNYIICTQGIFPSRD